VKESGLVGKNFVVLRDVRRRCYQRGISDELSSIPKIHRWMQDYVAQQDHVRRVFCLGTSWGGYAALVFGHLLKAEMVWAFAPATYLYWAGQPYRDVRTILSEGNRVTRYSVHYSSGNPYDLHAARRLRACPGVQLVSHPGRAHDVLGALARRKGIRDLLPAE
jgi:hypothetical protein